MNPYIIVMEGLDASGKSTLANLLAQKLCGKLMKTPPRQFRERCAKMDSNRVVYSEKRFFLYLESVRYISDYIKFNVAKHKVIVLDRWIWTTFAYHFAFNPCLKKKREASIDNLTVDLIKPDLSLLVNIDNQEIWFNRLSERGMDITEEFLLKRRGNCSSIIDLYKQYNPEFKIIDNSGTIEQSLEYVYTLLPEEVSQIS